MNADAWVTALTLAAAAATALGGVVLGRRGAKIGLPAPVHLPPRSEEEEGNLQPESPRDVECS